MALSEWLRALTPAQAAGMRPEHARLFLKDDARAWTGDPRGALPPDGAWEHVPVAGAAPVAPA